MVEKKQLLDQSTYSPTVPDSLCRHLQLPDKGTQQRTRVFAFFLLSKTAKKLK
jgi:hypothetical protein